MIHKKSMAINSAVFRAVVILFFFCWFIPQANVSLAASVMTMGQDDGYSARALDKIVKKWDPPTQLIGEYKINLLISVDGDGNFLDCQIRKSSGLDALDVSACAAAKAAAPFGSPPYGMPAALYFSFWAGNKKPQTIKESDDPLANIPVGMYASKKTAKEQSALDAKNHAAQAAESVKNSALDKKNIQAQNVETGKREKQEKKILKQEKTRPLSPEELSERKRKYISTISWNLRKAMVIPKELAPGEYHITARVQCNASGKILKSSILSSSGDTLLDKYALQGIKRAGSVEAPHPAYGDTFDLNFTIVRK